VESTAGFEPATHALKGSLQTATYLKPRGTDGHEKLIKKKAALAAGSSSD
jgi:hypothetical protein